METIELKVYEFKELSQEAKDYAFNVYQESEKDYFGCEEVFDCLKSIVSLFANITDYSVDYCGYERSYLEVELSEEIEEIEGNRLRKYLCNNFDKINPLYLGKKYKPSNFIGFSKFHEDCTYTGLYAEHDILKPIYDFIVGNSNNNTMRDILEDCINSGCKLINNEYDHQNSLEYFEECCCDTQFLESGEICFL